MKKSTITIIAIIILVLLVAIYFFTKGSPAPLPAIEIEPISTPNPSVVLPKATTNIPKSDTSIVSIGTSVQGNSINAYHFGTGPKELLFVGGIHGGYEWNTALLAYNMIDYLKANPDVIPAGIKLTVIPVLNPDGLKLGVGTTTGEFSQVDASRLSSKSVASRFNANKVDLNRNFDCDWKATGVWQSRSVSGGGYAFSEPESQAIKDYISKNNPTAAVVWYSSAGGVYASSCDGAVMPETEVIGKMYSTASGYPYSKSFDSYETNGDMVNWMAQNKIPAISILLTNHTETEDQKNQSGLKALLDYYSK